MNLKELGFTKEELFNRVVDQCVHQLLSSESYDEDGTPHETHSRFQSTIQKLIKDRIDETVNAIAEKHVLPNVTKQIESVVMQETNRWGEATGKPLSFIEYISQRAEKWMTEPVNRDGKTKGEDGYSSFSPTGSRINYIVDAHLSSQIKTAIEAALKDSIGTVSRGIHEACRLAINQVATRLDVKVKV